MNVADQGSPSSTLASIVRVERLGLDQMSTVRQLHFAAFKAIGGSLYSEREVQAFHTHVYSNTYADRLFAAHTFLGWIDDHLVATSSWCQVADDRRTARIGDLFVDPLFLQQGIGRLMLNRVENAAVAAGYSDLVVRAGYHALPVFEASGYALSSRGIYQLTDEVPLAVAFMRKTVPASSGS